MFYNVLPQFQIRRHFSFSRYTIFFLEHAGELRIIVLIEEKRVIHRPKHTHTPTNTWKLNHRLKQKDDPTATTVL